jgi:L-lactate dehydrogenase complex protein LldF
VSTAFRRAVRQALANPVLQEALDNNALRRRTGARRANATLPDLEAVRQRARGIREAVLRDWDGMLSAFAAACQANGVILLRASSAEEACDQVLDIARRHAVRLVAKSKSMVTEEIHLNAALEKAGLEVIETDLGEYIVQLRGEPPAHIITPALHLRRQEVGRTFADRFGTPYTEDVSEMTAVARRNLRQVFLTADMGISGVNLASADTGTLCLVTNEGNGRMVTTLPRVHVALLGAERLVPTLEDMGVVLQLLPRNATGQILTSYITLIQRPGDPDAEDGASHRYVVLVDNGRLDLQGTPLAEALLCIRCGACLDNCPVFQELGGHAYQSPYPGPIGSVVSPGLFGIERFGHLAKASSLCGACKEACPIGIDIPRMLLHVRQEYAAAGSGRKDFSLGLSAFSWVATHPSLYAAGQRLAGTLTRFLARPTGWLRWLPPPADGWTRSRHFPAFAGRTLQRTWRRTQSLSAMSTSGRPVEATTPNTPPSKETGVPAHKGTPAERFTKALRDVSGEVVIVRDSDVPSALREVLQDDSGPILVARQDRASVPLVKWIEGAGRQGLECTWEGTSKAQLEAATWGVVQARAGIADSGSVVLSSNPSGTMVASLLPPALVVILRARNIHADYASWLADGGRDLVSVSPMVELVTGPSRTSDIEMTMTLGVHAPGRLVVILLADEN